MSAKQWVENLGRLLRARFRDALIEIDAPTRPKGDWFIDATADGRSFVITFRPGLGFGLSSVPSEGIGEGPDEFFQDGAAVVARMATLLDEMERTRPQRVRILQELRERQRISQIDLAGKMGVGQPAISKIERRGDVSLSTLRRYVEALGGELHVTATFADEAVEIAPPSDPGE
jgi:DNA-binding XRE family transcriptional regulator